MRDRARAAPAPRAGAADTCGSMASAISSSASISDVVRGTCSSSTAIASVASACIWIGSSPSRVQVGQEVLPQQGLGVLLPGRVQQQRHVVQLRRHVSRARAAAGLRPARAGPVVVPRRCRRGRAGTTRSCRRGAGSRPSRRPATRASAARGRCRRWRRSDGATAGAGCRRRPRPAGPSGPSVAVSVDVGAGVQQRVGDDLADQQHGGLDEVLAAGRGEQRTDVARASATLAGCGGNRTSNEPFGPSPWTSDSPAPAPACRVPPTRRARAASPDQHSGPTVPRPLPGPAPAARLPVSRPVIRPVVSPSVQAVRPADLREDAAP